MVTGVGKDRIHPSGGVRIALAVFAFALLIRVVGGTPAAQAMFSHPEWEEFRLGFQEVSPDLRGWYEGAKDLGLTDLRVMTARTIARWATDEELVEVYRFRSEFFTKIAPDPTQHSACAFDALWNERARYPRKAPEAMTPLLQVAGRSMARMHEGEAPWEPGTDLAYSEAGWEDFVNHFDEEGLEYVIDALLLDKEAEGDMEFECLVQAALYGETVERSDLRIGDGRLLDFVREMEILATEGTEEAPHAGRTHQVGRKAAAASGF